MLRTEESPAQKAVGPDGAAWRLFFDEFIEGGIGQGLAGLDSHGGLRKRPLKTTPRPDRQVRSGRRRRQSKTGRRSVSLFAKECWDIKAVHPTLFERDHTCCRLALGGLTPDRRPIVVLIGIAPGRGFRLSPLVDGGSNGVVRAGALHRRWRGRPNKAGPPPARPESCGHHGDPHLIGHLLVVDRAKNDRGILGGEGSNRLHGDLGLFELERAARGDRSDHRTGARSSWHA